MRKEIILPPLDVTLGSYNNGGKRVYKGMEDFLSPGTELHVLIHKESVNLTVAEAMKLAREDIVGTAIIETNHDIRFMPNAKFEELYGSVDILIDQMVLIPRSVCRLSVTEDIFEYSVRKLICFEMIDIELSQLKLHTDREAWAHRVIEYNKQKDAQ